MLPNTLLLGQAVYLPGSGAFRGLEGAEAFQEGIYCLFSFPATTVLHGHGPLRPLLGTELREELSPKQAVLPPHETQRWAPKPPSGFLTRSAAGNLY